MLRKLWVLLILIFAMSVYAMQVLATNTDENTYLQAYTLCYNSTHNGAHEGIQAGWTMDDRAGNLRTNIKSEYNVLQDTSKVKSSALYRDLNFTDCGVVDFSTNFRISVGLDGFEIRFMDSNKNTVYSLITEDGYFNVLQPDGSLRKVAKAPENQAINVAVQLDLDNKTSTTFIENADCGTDELLSDNIMRLAYMTTHEDVLSVTFNYGTKIVANYYMHDDFVFDTGDGKTVPFGWSTTDKNSGYIASSEGAVKGGATLTRDLSHVGGGIKDSTLGGKLAFEGFVYVPENAVTSFTFMNGENVVADLSFDEKKITSNGVTVYDGYLHQFWYRFRMEMDLDNHTSVIKINGRELAQAILPQSFDSIDSLKLTGTNGGMRFDNLKLFSLVEFDDYVSEPVIPKDSYGNIVGINVCSLWSYSSNHGWACVTPYEDFRPVLGYYDEGSPESADWEIKMMTEHGIDFQAFCWYADQANAPMKNPRNMLQLHDGYMNAKYSDKMKYCIIWEASNGAHPKSIDAFKNYFVPHWIENYFKDPRYMTIDNKIVLMCFGYANFINDMSSAAVAKEAIDYLRQEVTKLGFDGLILISSHGGNTAQLKNGGADAVCAYNWGNKGYDLDYSIGRIEGLANGPLWAIPTLSTGFNSLPWHGIRYKNMTPSDFKKGLTWIKDSYFKTYKPVENWQNKLMILSTWNEYGEGTYIMPAEKLYGYGYLESLRAVVTDGDNVSHTDSIPTSAQLARITKNYPQHIRLLRRNDMYEPDFEKSLFVKDTVVYGNEMYFNTGKCSDVSYENGVRGVTESSLSYVETRGSLSLDAEGVKYLRFTMSVSTDTTVKVYLGYEKELSYYYENSATFTANAGGMREYLVPVTTKNGSIDKIRILPSEKSGVEFLIEKVETLAVSSLYVDEKYIDAAVYAESAGDVIYYPFDPGQAQGYIMGIHFEWDYDSKTLTLYNSTDDEYIKFTAGSDIAASSKGNKKLPAPVYLSDGLPMIHMETVCDVLDIDYEYRKGNFHVKTENYQTNSYCHTRPESEWDFTSGSSFGWTVNGNLYNTGNELYVYATDRDTRMQHTVALEAWKYSKVEVCIKYDKVSIGNDTTSVYFITNNDKTWDENKGIHLRFTSSAVVGKYITHTFDIASLSTWKDTITGFRYDPFNGADSLAYIKYIKLIPSEEYISSLEAKYVFESVTLDAENGKIPFNSDDTNVTIADDPVRKGNKMYVITPVKTSGYIGVNYDMNFEPGATYSVSFDVMGGSVDGNTEIVTSALIHPDPRYDDPSQYNNKNPDDHNSLGKTSIKTNTPEWTNISYEFTVNPNCFLKSNERMSKETFRIYSNPVNSKSVLIYLDNLVITKKNSASLSLSSAVLNGSELAVKGSSGRVLGADENVMLGVYDGKGRMIASKLVNCNVDKDFEIEFQNVATAVYVKGFFWTGLRRLAPVSEAVSLNISE